MTQTKICKSCEIDKPLSEFHKHKQCRLGVLPQCRLCYSIIKKNNYNPVVHHERYLKNRDAILAKEHARHENMRKNDPERWKAKLAAHKANMHKRYEANPSEALYRIAKGRAKRRGYEFTIELSDITVPDKCPVLGIALYSNRGKGTRQSDNSPTLDRVDNSKGYIKGNVQVISWKANQLKSNGTLDEFRALVKWLEQFNP